MYVFKFNTHGFRKMLFCDEPLPCYFFASSLCTGIVLEIFNKFGEISATIMRN